MKTLLCVSTALLAGLAAFQDGKQEGKAPRKEKEEPKKERTRVKPGDAAPEFTVKTLDGKDMTLATLRGEKKDKVVVVNFWSHTCPWSRGWDAELSKIAKDYAGKSVVVVSVDSNKPDHSDGKNTDSPDNIREYRKAQSLNFEVYTDSDHKVANAFGAETTPDIFVIGLDGKVAYTGQINDMASPEGGEKVAKNYLRDSLDAVLAGKAVTTPSTSPKGCSIKRAKRAEVKQ
jgi:peroxiredoxin